MESVLKYHKFETSAITTNSVCVICQQNALSIVNNLLECKKVEDELYKDYEKDREKLRKAIDDEWSRRR
jgi:hypothetical protein